MILLLEKRITDAQRDAGKELLPERRGQRFPRSAVLYSGRLEEGTRAISAGTEIMAARGMFDLQRYHEVRSRKIRDYERRNVSAPTVEEKWDEFRQLIIKGIVEYFLSRLPTEDGELLQACFGMAGGIPVKSIAQLARERGCTRRTLDRRIAYLLCTFREMLEEECDNGEGGARFDESDHR